VTGDCTEWHNEEHQFVLFTDYDKDDQIKEVEMGRACSTHGGDKK
jgi:hypothetical protein